MLVAGWLTHHDPDGPDVPHVNDHGDAPGIEDVHYNLSLDAAFLDRMYGPNGLSKALNDAVWPGNPPAPIALPFANVPLGTPSAPKGVDFNSWILLGNNYDLHGELNAWHTQDTGHEFSTHFKGRGPHPESWVNPLSQDTDAWFPFHPLDPEGTGQQLQEDDYVLMRGTLWQDVNHGAPPGVWDIGPTVNHTGWSEFHPIDWIIRVRPPQPNVRLTKLQVKNAQGAAGRWASGWGALEATYSTGSDFRPSAPNRMLQLRWVQGLIDNRVTNVVAQAMQIKRFDDHIEGHLTLPASKPQLRFKATWLLGWSEIDPQMDQVWVNDQLPPLAALYGDGEGWDWNGDNVFFGQLAHRSTLTPGMHQHYFLGATPPMTVTSGNTLFAMVYLDPNSPPDEVMLQWHTTDWLSRAYWGENRIDWGTDGTADRLYMGPLPRTGEWVRLEVPATAVGMNGTSQAPSKLDGMAFTLFGGRAIWDYAGVNRALPPQNAAFTGQNMASLLQPSQTFSAMVTMKNTGLTTWVAGGNTPYRLGSQNPQDNTTWSLKRVDLPTSVPPGASVTFNFTVKAPTRPGVYNFQWRMVNEAVEWFGDFTPNVPVSVGATATVPNLIHHAPEDASAIAQRAGFVMSISSRTVVKNLKNPIVVQQGPSPGDQALRGSTISVGIDIPPGGP